MKLLKDLLEEINEEKELLEAKGDLPPEDDTENLPAETDQDDDEEEKEEKLQDHVPDGKGHYTPDDLREIIEYCGTLIEKEQEDEDDAEKTGGHDVGEIGLDLIAEYADLLPETVINQIVDDLKDIFEIDDTMLEGIIEEGSAFFTKSKKGPAAKAAKAVMLGAYVKNKGKIKKRNVNWRTGKNTTFAKIAALHKKIFKGVGKLKGKRLHAKG